MLWWTDSRRLCADIWEIFISVFVPRSRSFPASAGGLSAACSLCFSPDSVYLNTAVISASRLILLGLPDDLLMFFFTHQRLLWCVFSWEALARVSDTETSSGFISPSLSQIPVFYHNNTVPPGLCSAIQYSITLFVCFFVFIWRVILNAKRTWALERLYINHFLLFSLYRRQSQWAAADVVFSVCTLPSCTASVFLGCLRVCVL